jgi:pimeloyl-ACP methyl ester carboxylesterase
MNADADLSPQGTARLILDFLAALDLRRVTLVGNDKSVRRDLAKFARGVHPNVLLDATSRLGEFTGPVRILWGDDDPYFGVEPGRQLSDAFPHSTLSTVPGGRAFLPLDHPDQVASEITAAVS